MFLKAPQILYRRKRRQFLNEAISLITSHFWPAHDTRIFFQIQTKKKTRKNQNQNTKQQKIYFFFNFNFTFFFLLEITTKTLGIEA